MTPIHLSTPPGYNFSAVIDSHGWRALDPFRWDAAMPDLLGYTLLLPTGRAVPLTMRAGVEVEVAADDLTDDEMAALRQAARTMLALDMDLSDFYAVIADEPRYAWVQQQGAGRLLTAPTGWEDLVKTLLTTNVSWVNTENMVARLMDYGIRAPDGSRAFPTPSQILAQDPEALNDHVRSGYRIKSLVGLAQAIHDGLDVEAWRHPDADGETLYKEITALHGFGVYAAGSVLRLWGHHDALGLDSVARGMFAERYGNGEKRPDAEIEAFYAPYGRWRGLAMWMDVIAPDG